MIENLQETLCEYIEDSLVVEILYKGKYRFTFEPYLFYRAKNGGTYVHGWKVAGDYENTKPPHWCNLDLRLISEIRSTGDIYLAPMIGYKPKSNSFYQVILEWKPCKLPN